MQELVKDAAAEYLPQVVQAIIGIVMLIVSAALIELRKRTLAWIEAKTTASQRETLHRIAQEAFAHAETVWKAWDGPDKLEGALDYASRQLKAAGISVSPDEIKAAIHDAWLKFDQGQQAAGIKATNKVTTNPLPGES